MSDEYIAEVYKNDKFRVKIISDFDPESPREWDNLGTMACWHSRYSLGDKHDFSEPEDFAEWLKEDGKGAIVLPLYLYDHSGITMSTGRFSCPWDSGQVGWIYCERDTILKEYSRKRITKKLRELVIKNLQAEVGTYDQYLTGDVWGFVVEVKREDGDWDHEDSCWGFYGSDPKENGMWDHFSEEVRKLVDPKYVMKENGYFMDKQIELPLEAAV